MKILFIQPDPDYNNNFILRSLKKNGIPSLTLAFPMLAAVTPKKHSILMIDERFKEINFNTNCDLVGITAITQEVIRAYEIADEFRKRRIPVIIGGWHASALPYEAKQHADSVVIGEAEETWPQLLNDFEKNKLKPFYYSKKPVDLKKIPPPHREILKEKSNTTGIQSSRGCPNGCKFCAVTNSLYGNVFRTRKVDHVIKEIKSLSQKYIMFYDTSLTTDVQHSKYMFREIINENLNKKFICLGNSNILSKDDKLLELSREAGCIQWNVGFESISQEVIDKIGKKTNNIKTYIKTVEKIHKHCMNVNGLFLFGLDGEDQDVFKDTLNFIKKSQLDVASFSILTPFPGTPIYEEFIHDGRILTKDWSKYRYQRNVVFKPESFTREELIQNVRELYTKYYSYQQIFNRFKNVSRRGFKTFQPFPFILDVFFKRFYYLHFYKLRLGILRGPK